MDTVIKSPNYHEGRLKQVRLVVVHTMETAEVPHIAEDIAKNWFSKGQSGVSSHVALDADSECRIVDDEDTAWCAAGANADGLHAELAGRTAQSAADWNDIASKAILERFCQRAAKWCKKYNIPVRRLTVDQVRDGVSKGLCGHNDVSLAFPIIAHKYGSHSDPGKNFPWVWALARIKTVMGAPPIRPIVPVRKPIVTKIALLTVDGLPGRKTVAALQQWAGMKGLAVDGDLGHRTWAILQGVLKIRIDGWAGPKTWSALQARVGAPVDGKPGIKTWKAIQTFLNKESK